MGKEKAERYASTCPKCGAQPTQVNGAGNRSCFRCSFELPPYPLDWVGKDEGARAPTEIKRLVISVADKVGTVAAARSLGIVSSTVSNWRKQLSSPGDTPASDPGSKLIPNPADVREVVIPILDGSYELVIRVASLKIRRRQST